MNRDPCKEYSARLDARRASVARCDQRHRQIGNARLLVFLAAVALAWLAWGRGVLSAVWLVLPPVVFIGLVVWHERVLHARRKCQRAVDYYETALARLDGRWSGRGETGERFLDKTHPYAEELDLFGHGSLFQLLSTVRTRMGEVVLAQWLLVPAPPDAVNARHQAVNELREMLDLREDLAVLGGDFRTGVHPEALAAWGEQAPMLDSRAARWMAFTIACLVVACGVVWATAGFRDPFFLMLGASAVYLFRYRRLAERVAEAVEQPAHDLALLVQVLRRFEQENFTSPRLAELRAALNVEGRPPSERIERLQRLIELLDSRDNVFMRLVDPPLLWTEQLAFAIEAWRKKSGPALRRWLDAVGEIETLCALSAYAWEHPADPFPDLAEGPACFDGEQLAHPLLGETRAVRNSLRLDGDRRVLIVSGSNMSGKSTLLRSVGANVVLAQAGAPVRARRLRLSPLAIGASIRIIDSLEGGTSRFYAEITRIRQIMDLAAGPLPVLFLLDELLHGTNSHDRRIGGEAIVRGLVERGAIGLITTHDLALAHIAEALAPRAANVHFQDHLEHGRITFDYLLRQGVVEKSNALELMRSVGLEV